MQNHFGRYLRDTESLGSDFSLARQQLQPVPKHYLPTTEILFQLFWWPLYYSGLMISVELMYIQTGIDLINLVALLPQPCRFQAVNPRLCGQ